MQIFHEPKVLQDAALDARSEGRTLALVPTMGALHEGHLNLIRTARAMADLVATSVFVNPTQFGPNEDLDAYPRDFKGDSEKCRAEGVDWLFFPRADEMYPPGHRTFVEVEGWGEVLCGQSRPTHFRGVATVVLKLFGLAQPTHAVFGWKDAQQFLILRKMAEDLNLPVRMIGVETTREPDGLAMSSRNAYLTEQERREAPSLYRALRAANDLANRVPGTPAPEIKAWIRERIESETSAKIDYVDIVSMRTLAPVERVEPGCLIALAAQFGRARLIDNVRVGE